ncbi:hypothetical protein TCAL_14778 [Tigriopus californicus]|uniref:Peroxidase n=1 Tax=Tigriopus californicus TaxID=6832 RepID=A0A553PR45_TIGCA|nr:chorion peroxidase-like [Tigriopus californicus]TRY80149.1 hypothetical protein TCAL_14778 [Tigriopus californicus]
MNALYLYTILTSLLVSKVKSFDNLDEIIRNEDKNLIHSYKNPLTPSKRSTPWSRSMDMETTLIRNILTTLDHGPNEINATEIMNVIQERLHHFSNRSKRQTENDPSFTFVCSHQKFQPKIRCDPKYPFRSINGQCNNLIQPDWGSINQPMERLVPNAYGDGIGVPRGGLSSSKRPSQFARPETSCLKVNHGSPLPNPRLISTTFHPDSKEDSGTNTLMVMQFGQYLDHDITFTVESFHQRDCCEDPSQRECFPIYIPAQDPFFGPGKANRRTCINFARSTHHCPIPSKPVEQMNTLTAFVDASHTYGSFQAEAEKLRTFVHGLLRTSRRSLQGKEMLPVDSEGHFFSGDIRGTEMPGLASVHTMFIREHNRIARELGDLNPRFSDEELFQRTRQIVVAQWQNIVYGEYLPIILGPRLIAKFRLGMGRSKYNPKTNPTITNAFATAAFRFGHSQIQSLIQMMSGLGNVTKTYRLRDHFFDMSNYLENNGEGMEQLLQGMISQKAAEDDRFVTGDVTNFLFPGIDLVARNVQRGRDHGLPGYNRYRDLCGLEKACSWIEVPSGMSQENWKRLSQIYASPNDIDLFVAGLAENNLDGGAVGPTFACILARQFQNLKFGDRFFFSHIPGKDVTNHLSPAQFKAIRRRTLRDILCQNTNIPLAQENLFKANQRVFSCRHINKLDLRLFSL